MSYRLPQSSDYSNLAYFDSNVAVASRGIPPAGMAVAEKNGLAKLGVNEEDLIYLSVPLIHEGANDNGDEFTAAEMQNSYRSIIGTPLDVDHHFDVTAIIGKNYNARYDRYNGSGIISVDSYVYANYHPDIATKIIDGVISAMSMEVHFQSAVSRVVDKKRIRTLEGCTFLGSGLVRMPGNRKALINDIRATASVVDNREVELALAIAIANQNQGVKIAR